MAVDKEFYNEQKDILYLWSIQDPVTLCEVNRTWAIAEFQDGKPNPFILPICDTVIPTAPAAPETTNVSFSLGFPISNNPKYAVNPVTPKTPR